MTDILRAVLVLGPCDTYVEHVCRALHAHGLPLASDAMTGAGAFARSRAVERLTARIHADLGIDAGRSEPLLIAGKTPAASRAEIAQHHLRNRRRRAATLLTQALDQQATTVIAGGGMMALPEFWFGAFKSAGIEIEILLTYAAPHECRLAPFAWQQNMLEVLESRPAAIVVPADNPGPAMDALYPNLDLPPLPVPANLADPPPMSAQTNELLDLLARWNEIGRPARKAAIAKLRADFDAAIMLTGRSRLVDLAAPPSSVQSERPDRPILIHYHLFKNAGTSVDAMLKENFGDRWRDGEFTGGSPAEKQAALVALLEAHPDVVAFSSHTALLPAPMIEGRLVLPIIFVRHPLTRLRSAYGFERRQDANTPGAILAKRTDFAGYVSTLLDEPNNRQVSDFQTNRFAFGSPGSRDEMFSRALKTLVSLPFVGLVEQYDRSIARLADLAAPLFPDFRPIVVQKNADGGAAPTSDDEKLAQIRRELGDTLYDRLVAANRYDLALHQCVAASYG